MVIRLCDTDSEIAATPSELRTIGDAIAGLLLGEHQTFLADPEADLGAYERILMEMEVRASSGLVRVSVERSRLLVEGDPERLIRFASWFQFPATAIRGHHGHYEWWPEHRDIAEGSLPLVVAVS